jgi:hypothetical protein
LKFDREQKAVDELSKQEIEPKYEHAYRRGYLAGFYAAIVGLRPRLSATEQAGLERWIEAELFGWSTDDLEHAVRPPAFPRLGAVNANRT